MCALATPLDDVLYRDRRRPHHRTDLSRRVKLKWPSEFEIHAHPSPTWLLRIHVSIGKSDCQRGNLGRLQHIDIPSTPQFPDLNIPDLRLLAVIQACQLRTPAKSIDDVAANIEEAFGKQSMSYSDPVPTEDNGKFAWSLGLGSRIASTVAATVLDVRRGTLQPVRSPPL